FTESFVIVDFCLCKIKPIPVNLRKMYPLRLKYGTGWLLLLCALFGAGCNREGRKNEKNVVYLNYSSGALESIDPAFAKNLFNMWTDHMVFNTLVETNDALQTVPSLATRWEVSEDGLTYLFYLRND